MDESLSNSTEKEEGELLIFDGSPEVGETCMFGKIIHIYAFIVCVILSN